MHVVSFFIVTDDLMRQTLTLFLFLLRYYGVWLITRCGSLMKTGYNLHYWGLCIFILILIGLVSRVVAFFGMITFQKKWIHSPSTILFPFYHTCKCGKSLKPYMPTNPNILASNQFYRILEFILDLHIGILEVDCYWFSQLLQEMIFFSTKKRC